MQRQRNGGQDADSWKNIPYERSGKMNLLCSKVSQLFSRRKKKPVTKIRGKNDNVLTEGDQIQQQLKECVEDLYANNHKPKKDQVLLESDASEDCKGQSCCIANFEKALSELINGKSEGIDNILVELLKALGSKGNRELFEICNGRMENGQITLCSTF